MDTDYISQLAQFLSGAFGWSSLAGLTLAVVCAFRFHQVRWMLLAATMFTATLGEETKYTDRETLRAAMIAPLSQLQMMGRPVTMVLLAACAVLVIATSGSYPRIPSLIASLLVVQAVLLVKMLSSQMISYAAFSAVVYVLWVFVFGVGVIRWLRTPADLIWAFRCPCLSALAFTTANLVQAVIDPTPLLLGPRFMGTTSNPQFAAVLLGLTVPATAFLVSNRQISIAERLLWTVLLLVLLSLIIWTGSRTGALLAALSIVLTFRRRLQQMVVVGVLVAGGVAWLASEFGGYLSPEFLLRTEDTRSEMWWGLWANFEANPMFGAEQSGRLGFAENSWLSMASTCGMIGLIPLLQFGFGLMSDGVVLARLSTSRTRYAIYGDLIGANYICFLFGSIFEAYILGVINFPVPFIILSLAISQRIKYDARLAYPHSG